MKRYKTLKGYLKHLRKDYPKKVLEDLTYWAYSDDSHYQNFKRRESRLLPKRYSFRDDYYLDDNFDYYVLCEQHLMIKLDKNECVKLFNFVYPNKTNY